MSRARQVLLQPSRLGTIVFVVAVAIVCVLLGRWQLSRLEERRALNAALEARSELPALTMTDVIGALDDGTPATELEFRRVVVDGSFRPDEEVLQRNRSHEGQSGFHVVTPFLFDDGRAVMVRRGWVPAALEEPPVAEAEPPRGPVTITGLLRAPERPEGFGPSDPEDGALERVFWIDPHRLDAQTTESLVDIVIDLEHSTGNTPRQLPEPLPPLAFDEANHLSYAIQWFSFAVIALVGIAAYARSRWFRDGAAPSG